MLAQGASWNEDTRTRHKNHQLTSQPIYVHIHSKTLQTLYLSKQPVNKSYNKQQTLLYLLPHCYICFLTAISMYADEWLGLALHFQGPKVVGTFGILVLKQLKFAKLASKIYTLRLATVHMYKDKSHLSICLSICINSWLSH